MNGDFNERVSDHLDQAGQTTAFLIESRCRQAAGHSLPEQSQNPDGTWPHVQCIDCDSDIPTGRLVLGKVRCLVCQAIKEKRAHGYFPIYE